MINRNKSIGDFSTGKWPTGNWSTGNWSTGNESTGNRSTGHNSTGNESTGNRSTGHNSTGDCSTGNESTGHNSTGDCSTGYGSTGDFSTGSWSISHHSTGHFSTENYSGFGCFDKPCSLEDWSQCEKPDFLFFKLTEWVKTSEMTSDEKEENPDYEVTSGYLKVLDYKEAFRRSYEKASQADRDLVKKLPNFDADKFFQISGIDLRENDNSSEVEKMKAELLKMVKNLFDKAARLDEEGE